MSKKKTTGRKQTDRNIVLYTRVSKQNKQFLSEVSIHAGSEAHMVNTLLNFARLRMTRTQIKELCHGKKAGNKVQGKVSKAAGKAA